MDIENTSQLSESTSVPACTNSTRRRVLIAVRSIAAGLLGIVLFAYLIQPSKQEDPLSPTEQMLVGTWDFPVSQQGFVPSMTFHSDRTFERHAVHQIPGGRWRVVDSSLVLEFEVRKLESIVSRRIFIPFPLPAAVTDFEIPSFMAVKRNYARTIKFSRDGRILTLGPLGAQSSYDLYRSADKQEESDRLN